jgi:hypothetical protein
MNHTRCSLENGAYTQAVQAPKFIVDCSLFIDELRTMNNKQCDYGHKSCSSHESASLAKSLKLITSSCCKSAGIETGDV